MTTELSDAALSLLASNAVPLQRLARTYSGPDVVLPAQSPPDVSRPCG